MPKAGKAWQATCCAPFSLEKTTYDAARGAVIYRSKLYVTL